MIMYTLQSCAMTALLAMVSYAQDDTMTTEAAPACTGSLSQSDADNGFFNPCPQYFDPLPSQGALSGSSLTIFGFPALVDFSGSVVSTDGTSTTYALTCQDSELVDIIGSPCTASGVVFPLTASGWNWHVTTTLTDEASWISAASMTATINPAGTISFDLVATVTPKLDSSVYSTTHTWTGNVQMADPSVVPIVGLAKVGGSDVGSSSATASGKATSTTTGGSVTQTSGTSNVLTKSQSPGTKTTATNGSTSSSLASSAGTTSKGAAAISIRGYLHSQGTWIALVGGSIAIGILAFGL